MKKMLLVAMVIVSMIGIAAAWATLGISPDAQNIDIGTYGYYTLTLNSNNNMNALNWAASDPSIVASIDGGSGYGSDAQIGSVAISYIGGSGSQTYTLRVMPQAGATVGQEYDVTVTGIDANGVAKAMVTGSVSPIPEVATAGLVGLGLIGLVVLRRKK